MTANISETVPAQQLADAQARIAELERALAEANETQTLFRIMVDAIPARVFWKDVSLTYLGANRKFAEDAGLTSPEQMLGKSDYELSWREQAELYRADDRAVIDSGVAKINFEEPQTTPDGGRIWLETSKIPLRNAAGETIGVMGTYSDITPRKRDQQALIDSEAKANALIEVLPDLVFVVKRDGTFMEYHARQDSDLYVPPDRIIGQSVSTTLPPPLAAVLLEKIGAALDTETTQSLEYSLPLPAGESYYEARLSRAGEGTVVVVARNVTERKRAEAERERLTTEALAQNERLDRALSLQKATFASTADGILAVDSEGKVITANDRFAQMWQIPADILATGDDDQLLGSVINKLKSPEAFLAKVKELYGKPAETSHDSVELADGRTFERYSAPQRMGDQIIGRVWNFRDVTERTKAEEERARLIEELQIANRIARESSRAKSEFLATMSHELRTPLNAIIGFSDMLLLGMSGPLNEKQAHKMERLKENSRRLLALINDLLDLTRIEAGRVEIVQKAFSPKTLVERLAAQIESLAHESHLEFTTKVGLDVPPLLIGDEKRIEQVILNLLSNAFKFTEKGSVSLTLDADETHWALAVSDTGIGIPPHAQNLIFEAFRQVDGSFSRAYQGSGLGLSIARDLVRMMDGKITLKSAVGVGSTFTVTLPINVPAAETQHVLEPVRN
ncbi:MAG: PAS domain-containing protein [Anaerolineae bacterium]|nr:PAS domain-containing protein [Anaerolineae bacterium]